VNVHRPKKQELALSPPLHLYSSCLL